jgi:hypothetical protein
MVVHNHTVRYYLLGFVAHNKELENALSEDFDGNQAFRKYSPCLTLRPNS